MAVELALYDYKESLGLPEPVSSRMARGMEMRKDDIAEILGADAQSTAAIKGAFADLEPTQKQPGRSKDIGGIGF